MSKLIPDILILIIEELDNEYKTLFNCLLVNNLWIIKDYYKIKLLKNQEAIIEKEFYDLIYDNCSTIKCLDPSNRIYKENVIANLIRLKDHLTNIVEFKYTQFINEKIFYILAENCFNIKKLKGGSNLMYNLDKFYKENGRALINHVNTLKYLNVSTRICIPFTSTLYSFANLETLKVKELIELIQNTGGYLKIIEIYRLKFNFINEYMIQIIRAVHKYCPQLEYFYFPFVESINNTLEDLLINSNHLKTIVINNFYVIILNGDVLLKILSKSVSKKLQHIKINGYWEFSVNALEEFLNNWKENIYFI
ncbi:hypothetical protein C1645_873033 [Glomus cerebriforme]|uniref:F-box domain-containing protein n=1 Tax=Glomus cerebriforme TaxID=658196 RepID=A0A397TJ98_9GLOM|nr:hypothetical protein C1645_873033 [Glomus cerebriforme]